MNKLHIRYVRIALYVVLFSAFALLFKTFDTSTGGEFLAPQIYPLMLMLSLTVILILIVIYFWIGPKKSKKITKKAKKSQNLK